MQHKAARVHGEVEHLVEICVMFCAITLTRCTDVDVVASLMLWRETDADVYKVYTHSCTHCDGHSNNQASMPTRVIRVTVRKQNQAARVAFFVADGRGKRREKKTLHRHGEPLLAV